MGDQGLLLYHNNMKRNILFALTFLATLSLAACAHDITSSNIESTSSAQNTSSVESTSSSASSSVFSSSFPSKDGGISLEDFETETKKLPATTESRKIRITYNTTITLEGSTFNATLRDGKPMTEGTLTNTFVLESRNNSASDLKLVSGQTRTNYERTCENGIAIGISNWLSYQKTRKAAIAREAQQGWNQFDDYYSLNPYRCWMMEGGYRPGNADVEGVYYSYNIIDRTFDENGYCTSIYIKEYTYIDGTLIVWDRDPTYYKGSLTNIIEGTIEYLE